MAAKRGVGRRLLSVDWDFFFDISTPKVDPNAFVAFEDWHCHDSGRYFLETVWYERAAFLLAMGSPLPGAVGTKGFWDRFKFSPGCRLYYADSHHLAYSPEIRTGITYVKNFDAHHDCGYRVDCWSAIQRGYLRCEDWMMGYYANGAKLQVIYPKWKRPEAELPPLVPVRRQVDRGRPDPLPFDAVFVCRSSGWTGPWLDRAFRDFVAAAPLPKKNIDRWHLRPRQWDWLRACRMARAQRDRVREIRAALGSTRVIEFMD